jgi:ribosomal protein S18 acetylase RimI-like enzyme
MKTPTNAEASRVLIRDFVPEQDMPDLRRCFIELQDFERALDPDMPGGEQIADAYLELTFQRCREFDGDVIVAEEAGRLVGFAIVWTRYRSSEPDDDPRPHGFLSDLVVTAGRRGRGYGRELLREAEERVRKAGMRQMRVGVKAANRVARALYAGRGFAEQDLYLAKTIE